MTTPNPLTQDMSVVNPDTPASELERIKYSCMYEYGLIPVDVPQGAVSELFRMNQLWNQLVAHDHQSLVKYNDLMQSVNPDLKKVEKEIAELEEEQKRLLKLKNKERAAKRQKNVGKGEAHALLMEVNTKLKELRGQRRELKAETKVLLQPLLSAFFEEDKQAIAQLVKDSKCIWTNHELVTCAFDVARKAARKSPNARLNFHSFDGTGRWGFRRPGAEGNQLSDFSKEKNVFYVGDIEQAKAAQTSRKLHVPIRVRLCEDENGEPVFAEFKMSYHRPLPPNSRIKAVMIKRWRVGERFKYNIYFVLNVFKETALHPNEDPVAIDVGFYINNRKGLTVATAWDGQKEQVLELPQRWLERMDRCEALQSGMQERVNTMLPHLQATLKNLEVKEEGRMSRLLLRIASEKRIEQANISFHSLHKLYRFVKSDYAPELSAEFYNLMEGWFEVHEKEYREANFLRVKLLKQRTHVYRNWASKLAKRYGKVIVENLDLQQMVLVKEQDEVLQKQHRSNRNRAALYSLTQYLKEACFKSESEFILKQSEYTTVICSTCLSENAVNTRTYVCEHCGEVHDQDVNAAKNLLRLYQEGLTDMCSLLKKYGKPLPKSSTLAVEV